jgi:hypothetical protein
MACMSRRRGRSRILFQAFKILLIQVARSLEWQKQSYALTQRLSPIDMSTLLVCRGLSLQFSSLRKSITLWYYDIKPRFPPFRPLTWTLGSTP